MLKPSLSPGVAALLDEHAEPTHCGTQQTKAMLGPIEDVIAAARMQIATDRSLIRQAELDAALNPDILGKLQLLRRENATLAAAVEAAAAPFERLTDAMHRRDRVMAEFREVITTRDAIAAQAELKA